MTGGLYSLHSQLCQALCQLCQLCPQRSHTVHVDHVSAVLVRLAIGPLCPVKNASPHQTANLTSLCLFYHIVNSPKIFGAVRTNLSQNYVTYSPGQASSPPIPRGSSAGSVLPVAPPAPQVRVCRLISDWLQRVPMISFVGIVEPLEDTRCELIFTGSPSSHLRSTDSADLDEVEAFQPPRLDSTQFRVG